MAAAFDYSDRICLPVLMRVTTRMAHSRAVVQCVDEPRQQNELNYNAVAANWVLLPANAKKRNDIVTAQQAQLEQDAAGSPYNKYIAPTLPPPEGEGKYPLGIIASGIGYNYVMEVLNTSPQQGENEKGLPILKISQYPLPKQLVRRLMDECEQVLIVEEGQPFIEDIVRGVYDLKNVHGKLDGTLPRTGELNPDFVKKALGMEVGQCFDPCADVAPRPPALCQGCGHRDVYAALNEVLREYDNPRVFGDIGCYTLGFLPPFRAIHSCVDMGA